MLKKSTIMYNGTFIYESIYSTDDIANLINGIKKFND